MIVNKYGVLTSSVKQFQPSEPLFLIRGTDPLAPTMAVIYHGLSVMKGCSKEFCDEVLDLARQIETWQLAHPDLIKSRPD